MDEMRAGDRRQKIEKKIQETKGRFPYPSLEDALGRALRNLGDLAALRQGEDLAGADRQLYENFYQIQQEASLLRRELRLARKQYPYLRQEWLAYLLGQVFLSGEIPFVLPALEEFLQAVQRKTPLYYEEFHLLPVVCKSVWILGLYGCFFDGRERSETEREMMADRCLAGLRQANQLDQRRLLQNQCLVWQLLEKDPAGIFPRMTQESKEYYASLAGEIAAGQGKLEWEEVRRYLELARTARREGQGLPKAHIGWYLLRNPQYVEAKKQRGRLLLLLEEVLPLMLTGLAGTACRSIWAGALLWLPLREICRPVLETFLLKKVRGDFLPRMNLKKIPEETEKWGKTIAAVSTLLPRERELPKLRERLERFHFANREGWLKFCVLADFRESDVPTDPADQGDIRRCVQMIQGLNRQYGNRFLLFLRRRTPSKTQGKYTGWERKRGAITELIRFCRGEETTLQVLEGDRDFLRQCRYLLALDSDTNLLFNRAGILLSAALHPLNAPRLDEKSNRMGEGYGAFSPKMVTDLESEQTAFSRLTAGNPGVPSYRMRTGSRYQDLWGEGIFAGKGLLDMEAFAQTLDHRFPPEQVLSHDILEGEYLRTGFLSDTELSDSTPLTPLAWDQRQHRWMRGDWQNLLFLFPRFRLDGRTYENPLSLLSRYKLWDNLCRSLLPISGSLALLYGACSSVSFTAGGILGIVALLGVAWGSLWAAGYTLFAGGYSAVGRKYFSPVYPLVLENLLQAGASLVTLFADGILSADAVLRSLWRTGISRRNLLEWTTAAQSGAASSSFWKLTAQYLPAQLLGLGLLFWGRIPVLRLSGLFSSALLPYVWGLSGRGKHRALPAPESREEKVLRRWCAQMWNFYRDWATEENHWLPPDNIQVSPGAEPALRTSPTNIGMMMLSALTARDLGFLDSEELCSFLSGTVKTLELLPKWQGNLYNWYDIRTLEVLQPAFVSSVDSGNLVCCLTVLEQGLLEYAGEEPGLTLLAGRIRALADQAQFDPFYDRSRKLFSIGYEEGKGLSPYRYDFLMSEARAMSYYAIARRQVPIEHWGALSRTMTKSGAYAGPVSWTGTMFEYFMPHLFLPAYEGSLLGEALRYALRCQKEWGEKKGIPWGISESGYYAFDDTLHYQYKAHGVPKLGVKGGLDRDLVVAPYAAFLALPWDLQEGIKNLETMEQMGFCGIYGFFEAADFTPDRIPGGETEGKERNFALIRSFMAHHVGMSLISAGNVLFPNRMQKRFFANREMASARELLQEPVPREPVLRQNTSLFLESSRKPVPEERELLDCPGPEGRRCILLSNGGMTGLFFDNGCSYLTGGGGDLTRRPLDLLRGPMGMFAFIQKGETVFSVSQAPFYEKAEEQTIFRQFESGEGQVCYRAICREQEIEALQSWQFHPGLACARQTITLKNRGSHPASLKVLLYLEPVLSKEERYRSHPAFSKLFVTSRMDPDSHSLLFSRRAREEGEYAPVLAVGFAKDMEFEVQTKRERLFAQRWAGVKHFSQQAFDAFQGTPDVCCAIRFSVTVPAGESRSRTLLLTWGEGEEQALSSLLQARNQGEISRKRLSPSPFDGSTLWGRLAMAVLPAVLENRRADPQACRENQLSQRELWPLGISGDLPLVLFSWTGKGDQQELLEAMLKAHGVLRMYGVSFDLVIQAPDGEHAPSVSLLERHVRLGSRGGVHLVLENTLSPQTKTLLKAASCVREPQIDRLQALQKSPGGLLTRESSMPRPVSKEENRVEVTGGTFQSGSFVVDHPQGLPFCHVLANPVFGVLLSHRTLGYTWAVNARENKLTPWYNDIAADNDGELLLARFVSGKEEDERLYDLIQGSQAVFSPREARFQGCFQGIQTEICVQVDRIAMAKKTEVMLKNTENREIELELALYLEPVLGVGDRDARYVQVWEEEDLLICHNPFGGIGGYAALSCTEGQESRAVLDRESFFRGIWREGDAAGRPCCARVIRILLLPQEERRFSFTLAFALEKQAAQYLARQKVIPQKIGGELSLETPNPYLNAIFSTFLPHQAVVGRMWARTGFYQCGGAWGFRDQLQDAGASLYFQPDLAKRQIFRCAAVQFEEGDVLHWWHRLPNAVLRGVRTRCSDDLVWLPYLLSRYVEITGDEEILDRQVAYLEGEPLREGEGDRYFEPHPGGKRESLYCHGLRALLKAYTLGEHGLPLMGNGDWNDGYSRVGAEGRGESVWLALFLALAMEKYIPLCRQRGRDAEAQQLAEYSCQLKQAVETYGWDGSWYLRAFYDNGTPMGSSQNRSCTIDSLPQSFAVFAGLHRRTPEGLERVQEALRSAFHHLLWEDTEIVTLFSHAFDCQTPAVSKREEYPGYVAAYPPGIRENGGQYTHGAVWLALALLRFGQEEGQQEFIDKGAQALQLLNPAQRCADPQRAAQYGEEPYYLAADIYTHPAAVGRGGWSLYTGAASWYFQAVLLGLVGIRLWGKERKITFAPAIPSGWDRISLRMPVWEHRLSLLIRRGAEGEQKGLYTGGQYVPALELANLPQETEIRAEWIF